MFKELFTESKNRTEDGMKSAINKMVKSGRYKNPTKAQEKSMISDVAQYDPAYSEEEALAFAFTDHGLEVATGPDITRKIKIVSSDKYSILRALEDSIPLAARFDVKLSKNRNGLTLKGKKADIDAFINLATSQDII